jgi:hypothetical protein
MQLLRALFRGTSTTWARSYVIATPVRRFRQTTAAFNSSEMETVNTTSRLAHLRDLMKQHQVDVYSELASYDCSFFTKTDFSRAV